MNRWRLTGALLLCQAPQVWAASSLPGLGTAITNFESIILAGAYILGFAALGTIIYSVARNRYGMPWDEGISTIAACVLAASAITILGWTGLGAASPVVPHQRQHPRL